MELSHPTKKPSLECKNELFQEFDVQGEAEKLRLESDWETFYKKRKEVEKESRGQKRSFQRRKEAKLKDLQNSKLARAVERDRSRAKAL